MPIQNAEEKFKKKKKRAGFNSSRFDSDLSGNTFFGGCGFLKIG